ncbi:LysR family transcriptional regulator [Pengzhenrongella sp.]|jgi:DNA-binding transcriptional LysR family regulator|uniref:LysR family transcriptional regulator n=1 Tax=Pengzhenrongella sp. TaxID=2888820 RepID=UPI002F920DAD
MSRDRLDRVLPLLPAFVALADTGQVTAAADALGVPQPTLTRSLQRAGSILGVALYEKSGRGVRLTPAGEAFLPFAREALRNVEAGMAAAAAPLRGRVAVAFQNVLGEDLVPALIRAFRADHPGVEFTLAQGSRAHCLELLRSSRADVAFLSPPPADDVFAVVRIGADELVVIVSRAHRLAGRTTVRLKELAGEPFVLMAAGFGLRSTVQELLNGAGIQPTISFEGQDIHTMVGLVAADLGVTIVPRRDYPATVRALGIHDVRAERQIVLAHPADRPLGTAAEAFRSLVATRGPGIAARAFLGAPA